MIDFYLLGIARSGTSVSHRVLNLHPKVYCGVERFPVHIHPESIEFPESFLDASIIGNPEGFLNAQSVISKMTDSQINTLHAIGDKLPRKIYAPSHLNSVKTNLFIYRPYQQVCSSWDVRAKNKNDHGWSKYRTGFISFFDLLVFFFFGNEITGLNCVDYKSCYFGDFESELAIWFNGLDVSLEEYPLDLFSKQILRKDSPKNTKNIDKRYDKFADFINLPEFEKNYSSSNNNSARVQCIKEYSQYIRDNHALVMNRYFELLTKYEYFELNLISNLIERNFTKDEKALFISSDMNPMLQLFFSEKNEKRLKQLVNIVPHASQLNIDLSHFLQKDGKLIEAISQVKSAITSQADVPAWHNRLANLLMQDGDNIDEAEKASQTAISQMPNNPNFHITLSRIHMKKNKLDQAIEETRKAIKIKADVPAWHNRLANLLMQSSGIDAMKNT